MTKKECFIKLVEEIFDRPDIYAENDPEVFENAKIYFDALRGGSDKEKPAFSEKGKLILQYLQNNKDNYNNLFKAKDIGEGMGLSSRTISGASRKLVTDGYLEKMGDNPVVYSLTDKGMNVTLDFSSEEE